MNIEEWGEELTPIYQEIEQRWLPLTPLQRLVVVLKLVDHGNEQWLQMLRQYVRNDKTVQMLHQYVRDETSPEPAGDPLQTDKPISFRDGVVAWKRRWPCGCWWDSDGNTSLCSSWPECPGGKAGLSEI